MEIIPPFTNRIGFAEGAIRHDHEPLRQLARKLKVSVSSQDVDRIVANALRFHKEIAAHIREEESHQGLYDEIARRWPHALERLKRLRDQHKTILSNLELICSDADDELVGIGPLIEECLALVDQHEREEEELLGETFYRN